MSELYSEQLFQVAQWAIAALSLFSLSMLIVYLARSGRNLRYSHSVAVLGYPRSGKTTLIVTLIHRILSSKLAKDFRVSGSETTEKVTEYHGLIVRGKNIGPTGDDDTFLYRFQYDKSEENFVIRMLSRKKRTFDIAIGDFPGEYTLGISSNSRRRRRKSGGSAAPQPVEASPPSSQQKNPTVDPRPNFGRLLDPEYYSWVSQADKYIILIDVAELIKRSFDSSEIRTQIYTAVVYMKESSLEDSKSLFEKPVALVFAKSDLLTTKSTTLENLDKINYKTANKTEFDMALFNQAKDLIEKSFSETIDLLSNNFSGVSVIFHSSYRNQPTFDAAVQEIVEFIVP